MSPLNLPENVTITIADEDKNINNKIFMYYFGYQSQSFLLKDFYSNKNAKKEQILAMVNDTIIDLRNTVRNNINENEKPDKVINIDAKILDFKRQ